MTQEKKEARDIKLAADCLNSILKKSGYQRMDGTPPGFLAIPRHDVDYGHHVSVVETVPGVPTQEDNSTFIISFDDRQVPILKTRPAGAKTVRKVIVHRAWYDHGTSYDDPPDGGIDPVYECTAWPEAVRWVATEIIREGIDAEIERSLTTLEEENPS